MFFGTFAASYSMFDVFIMFLGGVFGFVLLKHGYPFAPLILGVILGPMADENLRRTIWIFDGKFEELLYRPIGDILIVAVSGLSITASAVRGAKARA